MRASKLVEPGMVGVDMIGFVCVLFGGVSLNNLGLVSKLLNRMNMERAPHIPDLKITIQIYTSA